jgi:hypothetical protein
MRGRLAPDRNRPHAAGRTPDWASVAWYVYVDDSVRPDLPPPRPRVAPRELSPGELRRVGATVTEQLVAVVKRCSEETVKALLHRGVAPEKLQAAVDELAELQAGRMPTEPNLYVELLARLAEAARARNDRRSGEGVAP